MSRFCAALAAGLLLSWSPALAQEIVVPTPLTAPASPVNSIQYNNAGAFGASPLIRDSANILGQRNGVTGQEFDVYNTFTDSSNYELGELRWSANVLKIGTDALGTGSARAVQFVVGGTNIANFATTGFLLWNTNNTYDIGANGANAPRSIYAGTSMVTNTVFANAQITLNTDTGSLVMGASQDTPFSRSGPRVYSLGTPSNASPIAGTLQCERSRGGSDTNVAGANCTIQSGPGTGSATGSTLSLKTPHAGSTGTTQQTTNTQILMGDNTVAMPNLATSSSAQTGTVCSGASGNLTVDTTTTCLLSSRRYKMNIRPLDVGLAEVEKLAPVSYDLRPQFNPTHLGRQVGLVAEDVAKVDDRFVGRDAAGRPNGVRYQQLTALLVKGEQELLARLTVLERQNAALQAQLRRLHHHR